MNVDNSVPEIIVHVGEGLVTKDTGVVDQDVNAAESINGSLDDGVAILAGGFVANGLSTHLLDLLDDRFGIDQIVNHHGCTELSEQKTVRAAQTKEISVDP